MISMWVLIASRASAVMTGPTSTESLRGSPTSSSAIAPFSILSTRSATSSCRQRMRKAEQRCPAESKADDRTSTTTCSASAEESTTIALRPPVSAIRPKGAPRRVRRPASSFSISRATGVEPVKTTPWTRGSATSAAPTSPAPGTSCRASRGTPALCSKRTASAAISGVSSAGLAITELPAASVAATWPVKIASGKFHGLMQTTRPSGAGEPGSRVRAASWA